MIPCYNSSRFLEECLDAVSAQRRWPDEVILVDDGSTDDSAHVAGAYDWVKVVRLERNSGIGAARNAGIAEATGDLIAFLDADDIWKPSHLETVLGLLEVSPEAGLAFSLVRSFGERQNLWEAAIPPHQPVDAFWESWRRTVAQPSSVIVWRHVLQEIGGFDRTIRCVEDFECWLRIAKVRPFICTHEVTVWYRKYPTQTSRSVELCRRSEYAVRNRVLRKARAEDPPEFVSRLEREFFACWESRCREAWHARDPQLFDLYLELGESVPGSGKSLSVWRWRRLLLPVVRLSDRIEWVKGFIKTMPIIRKLVP